MVCNFLNAVDLRRNSTIFIGQKVCSLLHLHYHRPYSTQKAEIYKGLFGFQAMGISGDFSPYEKSSVKKGAEIWKDVTSELAE